MILLDAERRTFVRLDLVPLVDPDHWDWLSYRLSFGNAHDGRDSTVLLPCDKYPLFLDRAIEPEIPMICDGIDTVLVRGGVFEFSPVDEKDFRLKVAVGVGGGFVAVETRHSPTSLQLGWPLGKPVLSEDLKLFVSALRLEYDAVIRAYQKA